MGEDDAAFIAHPDTLAAQALCLECPLSRYRQCAADALNSGRIEDDGDRVRRAPSGIVAAGVICTGDNATKAALRYAARGQDRTDRLRCARCDRGMVQGGREIRPGDVRAAARGMCRGCYTAATRAGIITRPGHPTRPAVCVACSRPMVAGSRSAVRADGAVIHRAHGYCRGCYRIGLTAPTLAATA